MNDGVILDGVNDLYPPMILQEASTESADSDEVESEAEAKESLLSQYWNRSKYGHPDFERAHRLTILGTRVQIVSSVMVGGGSIVALSSFFKTAVCKDSISDCDSDATGPALVTAFLGATGYMTGLGISSLGSYAASNVLKKGVKVSSAGFITSAVGLGLGSVLISNAISINGDERQDWYLPTVLGAYAAVPVGLLVQQRINKKAYLGFVDEVSLAPIWTPDTTGAVLQVQF